MNEIWRKLSLRDKIRFIGTTLAGIMWIAYVLSGYPLGEVPNMVATLMWACTGVVGARLFILAMMIISVHLADVK